MAGKTRFESLADQSGRVRCIYVRPGSRKEREECVSDIPAFLLKAILKQIARENDELQVVCFIANSEFSLSLTHTHSLSHRRTQNAIKSNQTIVSYLLLPDSPLSLRIGKLKASAHGSSQSKSFLVCGEARRGGATDIFLSSAAEPGSRSGLDSAHRAKEESEA